MIINGRLKGISEWDVAVRSAERKARHIGSDEGHAHHARQLLKAGHSPESILAPHVNAFLRAHHHLAPPDYDRHDQARIDSARRRVHAVAHAIGHHEPGKLIPRTDDDRRSSRHREHSMLIASLHHGETRSAHSPEYHALGGFGPHYVTHFPSEAHATAFHAALKHHYPEHAVRKSVDAKAAEHAARGAISGNVGEHVVHWPFDRRPS